MVTKSETETDIFDANSGHCLAYWLDSSNVDHYHIHMIETCACVALILMILVYLQCKKWNMKRFYIAAPLPTVMDENNETDTAMSIVSNQQPLLNDQPQQYNTNGFTAPRKMSVDLLESSSSNEQKEIDLNNNNSTNPQIHIMDIDSDNNSNLIAIENENDDCGTASVITYPLYDESDSDNDENVKKTWSLFSKFSLKNLRKPKKYKKKYGIYPKSMLMNKRKHRTDPILLPCFMKIIYLFFGGVTFKFILATLATNNMDDIYIDDIDNYSNNKTIIILNSVVSFLDTILWYSLAFLLIQKSSSKRAFLRAFLYGLIFAFILCLLYGYSYSNGEPIAWNLSSICLLIYYGIRVFVCLLLVAFMYTYKHNHNRWKRWASLRFLIVFMFIINLSYVLAVVSMSIKNCNNKENNNDNGVNADQSTNTSALLDICWFTLVELLRNLIQPFILYGTLLKDTDYWRKLSKLLTMSSTTDVPRRGGTLDLSIENYKDIEAFAHTTRVPVLDFAEFELRKPIGRGATASVYRAYYRGYPVACKDLAQDKTMFNEITYDIVHRFCREALLFIHIQHINIIKFFGICLCPPSLYLVFELATHGTLRNLLDSSQRKRKRASRKGIKRDQSVRNKNAPLSWQDKLWIALDIATGMQVLHHKDIIHRDLNTMNVLVTFMKEEGRIVAKICDFGLARKLRPHHQDRVNSSFLMTSPLVLPGQQFTFPNLPISNNVYKQQQKQKQKHKNNNNTNSLPHNILTSGSANASMKGADTNNGLITSDISTQSPAVTATTTKKNIKNKTNKTNKKKKKYKKHKHKNKDKDKQTYSLPNSLPSKKPKPIDALPEMDEFGPTDPDDNVPLNTPPLEPTTYAPSTNSHHSLISNQNTLHNSLDALTTECGTVAYMAPELLEHLNITKHFTYAKENLVLYTKSIDVYSFGLILWELCTESLLYEDFDDLREIRTFVLNGNRPHIPSYILGTYASLMKDCWSQSPLHRPDFNEIVQRLKRMLGLTRNKSEDNSYFSWNLVDAMRESGH